MNRCLKRHTKVIRSSRHACSSRVRQRRTDQVTWNFGNWLRVYGSHALRLEVLRERGEWSILAGLEGEDESFDVSTWQACLGLPTIAGSIAQQCRFVRESLGAMEKNARRPASLLACLRTTRDKRTGFRVTGVIGSSEAGLLEPSTESEDQKRQASQRLAMSKGMQKRRKRSDK